MKLTAFKYGVTEIHGRMAFPDGDIKTKLPISLLFFLIEKGDKKILVDVGCDTMNGFELFEFKKPVEVLESYGVKRSEITHIVITHAHHDHIDAVRYYPAAAVYLHKNELENAKKYIADLSCVRPMEGDTTITEGVKFKFIGGHSEGSGIVLLDIAGKCCVLCGDECYTKENLLKAKPTGSSCNPDKSKAFVEEYRKDCYVQILFHDPDLVSEIGFKTLVEDNA